MNDPKKLFEENIDVAYYLYHELFPQYANDEDLKQEALYGFYKACQVYDPSKGCALSTLAAKCIKTEVLRYLRDTKRKNRIVFEDLNNYAVGDDITFEDFVETEDKTIVKDFEKWSDILTEDERKVLIFYLNGCRNQKKIAKAMGTSQPRVMRLKNSIKTKLLNHVDFI